MAPLTAWPDVEFDGVRLHAVTSRIVVEHLDRSLAERRGGLLATPNLDFLRRAWRSRRFQRLLSRMDLRVADGMPLVWASRLCRRPLPARVAGVDLVAEVCSMANEAGHGVLLVGGSPGAASAATRVLRTAFPRAVIESHDPGRLPSRPDLASSLALCRLIRSTHATIVMVGLGSPKQEELMLALHRALPGVWFLGVGNSFSFIGAGTPRAHPALRGLGLEWLHRLATEPRRLATRYLIQGLPYALRLLAMALGRRLSHHRREPH